MTTLNREPRPRRGARRRERDDRRDRLRAARPPARAGAGERRGRRDRRGRPCRRSAACCDLLAGAEPPIAGGTRRNREWVEPYVDWDAAVPEARRWLLCDAMTSGGLLVAAPPGARARRARRSARVVDGRAGQRSPSAPERATAPGRSTAPTAAPADPAHDAGLLVGQRQQQQHRREHVDAEQVVLAVVAAARREPVVHEPRGQQPSAAPLPPSTRRQSSQRPTASAAPAAPAARKTTSGRDRAEAALEQRCRRCPTAASATNW